MISRSLASADVQKQQSRWNHLPHGWFYERRGLSVVLGLAALLASLALVGVGVQQGITLSLAGGIALCGLMYFVLRYPSVLAYVALGWLVFEKIFEYHTSVNRDLVDATGNYLLVAALAWTVLLNLLRRRRALELRQIGAPLLLFAALSVVSALVNDVPFHVAQLGILSTTHAVIMFLIVVNVGLQEREIYRFIYAALAVLTVASVVAVLQGVHVPLAWQWAGGPAIRTVSGSVRVSGIFEHPNTLGAFMVMIVPLGLTLSIVGGFRGTPRTVLFGANIVMVIALALTLSRETWGALLLSVLFLGVTVESKLRQLALRLVVPGLLIGLLLLDPFLHRLQETAKGDLRFTLLQASLPVIRDHLLLGVGPGRYGGHVALVTSTPLYEQYHLPNFFYGTGGQIDMFWTHLVAEAGVLGTLAYLGMIGACFFVGRRAYRDAVTPRRKAVLLGLLFAIPGTVLISLLSTTLENNPTATTFWALMGFLVVLARTPDAVPVVAARGYA